MKPHYLLHEPGLGFPLIALALNILVVAVLWQWSSSANERLHLAWGAPTTESANLPQIQVRESGTITVNQQAVATLDDLQFKLSGLSANGNQLVLRYPQQLPAARLADLLQACSAAGFTAVGLQQIPIEQKP